MHQSFWSSWLTLFLSAAFALQSTAQCVSDFDTTGSGLTVNFTNQSTGGYNFTYYDFGDGNGSQNVANPSHTYADSGIYEVCLFIMDTNSWNCYDEHCDTLYFGSQLCLADFYLVVDQLDIEVYDLSFGSHDSLWFDFGDGNGSADTAATHTYDTAGFYDICLWLYDSGSVCDSHCVQVFVTDESCDADFSFSDDGLSVDFTDESSGPYNAVFWDFGDGFGWSEETNPTYTYFTAGTYEVCLYVYDTLWGSCEDEYCEFITVSTGGGGGCEADFEAAVDELNVSCINNSTGALIYSWDFGDGSSIVFEEDPQHTYTEPGTYDICLTILNPFPFCTDQLCETVTVTEFTCEPTFSYSFNDQNGFNFKNTTTVGDFTSVLWTFGDGNSSTFDSPTYFYNAPGTYEVCLTTYDGDNVCGETCNDVEVYPLGIKEAKGREYRVFPVPNSGTFYFQSMGDQGEVVRLVLRDLTGRSCWQYSGDLGSEVLEVQTAQPAGMYFLEVWTGQHIKTQLQVIIQ